MSDSPIPGRCGKKKTSSPGYCEKHPVKGATVCRKHGGGAPQVKKAAEVRAAKIYAVTEAERMVARAGVDADPIEHLLESLHRAAALVEVWGSMVAGLDAKAQTEYTELNELVDEPRGSMRYDIIEREHGTDIAATPADRLVTVNNKGESQIHPYVAEYNGALERRAKFAKLCIDAGVAERQVRILEAQAVMIAKFATDLVDALKIKRTTEVNSIIGTQLRKLEPNYG